MLNNKALPSFIGILWYPYTSVTRSVVALVYSHLPCGRSRGLCRCLWPGQSHRSWPLYCQKAKCSWLPGLGEYTVIETQITTHMNHTFTSIRTRKNTHISINIGPCERPKTPSLAPPGSWRKWDPPGIKVWDLEEEREEEGYVYEGDFNQAVWLCTNRNMFTKRLSYLAHPLYHLSHQTLF